MHPVQTNDPDDDDYSHHEVPAHRPSGSSDFSAPLGPLKHGRLVFTSSTNQVSLAAGRMKQVLYEARFKRPVPRLWLREDTLTIQYFPILDQPVDLRQSLAEIYLNGSIPWEIEFRSGVSGLKADLGRLQLRSLDLLGGASQMELVLAKPTGTVFIYVSGGLNQSTIRRPAGVGMRIQVSGGVRELVFDDRHLGAVDEETGLETPDFAGATCGYDICIAGGASHVTIGKDFSRSINLHKSDK